MQKPKPAPAPVHVVAPKPRPSKPPPLSQPGQVYVPAPPTTATLAVRLPVDLAQRARHVAAFLGVNVGDYLRALIEADVSRRSGVTVLPAHEQPAAPVKELPPLDFEKGVLDDYVRILEDTAPTGVVQTSVRRYARKYASRGRSWFKLIFEQVAKRAPKNKWPYVEKTIQEAIKREKTEDLLPGHVAPVDGVFASPMRR